MDMMDIIKNRRSIRAYENKKVEKEKLDLILEAAIWAPSSHNSQPWHFTVISNPGLATDLNETTKAWLLNSENPTHQKLGSRPDLFYGAPVVVVVSGKTELRSSIIDCSAAVQNMLLMAESLGLGTCWNGLVTNVFLNDPNHPSVKALDIPEGYTPFYAVAVGYPQHSQEAPFRKGAPINYLELI
ncbi:MAG: nitroreductase family protein [Clostridia bacterium]|nr:nitroreductase family protein [Clostridia bacterium]